MRRACSSLESADQELPLVDHLRREMVVDEQEELFVVHHLAPPLGTVNGLELVEGFAREGKPIPVNILVVGCPADGGLFAQGAATDSIDDPFKNAHVFAKAGPEESACSVFAEPVDVEDARGGGETTLHPKPVTEVVAHVVSAEGKHGHG